MRIWIWWAFLPFVGYGQTDWTSRVQPTGIASYRTSVSDPFAASDMHAALAFIDSNRIGLSIQNKYTLKGLSTCSLVGQLRTSNGGWGFQFGMMGNEVFNGFQLSAGYGIQLSKSIGLGVGAAAQKNQITGVVPVYTLFPQVGLVYSLSKNINIGFHIKKLFQSTLKSTMMYKEIISIKTGIGCQIDDHFYIAAEISNGYRQKSEITMYAEWMSNKSIKSFLMYQNSNASMLGGIQYRIRKSNVGMGVSYHNYLGNAFYLMMYHAF